MMRKSLAAAVAAAPLLAAMASVAHAETQITSSTTAPVATATVKSGAPDDITVTSAGSITPANNTAPAITLNSNNNVSNAGTINFKDVNKAVGIEVIGPVTGQVTNTGGVLISESYAATDSNADGLLDGPWSKQTGGVGIIVTGGTFTGSITTPGSVAVFGNGGVGIEVDSEMTGSLLGRVVNSDKTVTPGGVSVTGSNAVGILVTSNGKIDGDVRVASVTAQGDGAKAIDIEGQIGGMLNIAGSVSDTGYRTTSRTTDTVTQAKYTADELQQGGGAVTVAANVGGGIVVSAPPVGTTTTTANTVDADNDGVPDVSQGTGSITSFGTAPALQIGAVGGNVTVGALTTIDPGYGLVIQGTVSADGVFDQNLTPNLPADISATAIQIGVAGGGTTTIVGGLHNIGTISSNAYEADSTAIHIGSGATVDKIVNDGSVISVATTTKTSNAAAILIDQGATVTSLSNSKTISATIDGSIGQANAIFDASGTLSSISNTGTIAGQVVQTNTSIPVTGAAVAINDQSNATGVTLTQTQSTVTGATAPAITGAVIFGAGNDTINIAAGTLTGDMYLLGGANTLNVSGDATTVVTGGIFDTGGQLNVNVTGGRLSVTNAATITANSVNVGANGQLVVAADPQSGADKNTHFVTSGNSAFASGAQIGLTLQSLQLTDHTYTILSTTGGGTLQTGAFGTAVINDAPYLYTATPSSDANNIYLTVQRRTAAQLGFNASETAAYDAVFNALLKDTAIEKSFLAQTTRTGLITVYDQMLPDQGVGVFEAVDQATQSISNLTGSTPDAGTRVAGTSLWLQEVNDRVQRRTTDVLGSRAQLFGLVGGYEHMGAGGGAVGLTLSYLNVQDRDSAAAVGEHVVASMLEAGVYYRRAIGGLRFSARGAGGYSFFSGDREFVSPGVTRHANSTWGAFFADAHLGAAYEMRVGRFYVRPELSGDYIYLNEGAHTETGAGDGFDLSVTSRTSYRLSGAALVTLGTQFGRDAWLRPEIRGGYRRIFSGQLGDTTAQFTGSSTPFTLDGGMDNGGWATVGFSIKGGTSLSYVAVEGDADFRDGEQRYDLRLSGRSMF